MTSGVSKAEVPTKDSSKVYDLATQTFFNGTTKDVYVELISNQNMIYSAPGQIWANENVFDVQAVFTAALPKSFVAAEGAYQVASKGLERKKIET